MFMVLLQLLHRNVHSSLQRYEQRGSSLVDNHHAYLEKGILTGLYTKLHVFGAYTHSFS